MSLKNSDIMASIPDGREDDSDQVCKMVFIKKESKPLQYKKKNLQILVLRKIRKPMARNTFYLKEKSHIDPTIITITT